MAFLNRHETCFSLFDFLLLSSLKIVPFIWKLDKTVQTHKQTNQCVLEMTDNQNSLLEDRSICSLIPVLPKKDRWEYVDKRELPLKWVLADTVGWIYTHPTCPSNTSSPLTTDCLIREGRTFGGETVDCAQQIDKFLPLLFLWQRLMLP